MSPVFYIFIDKTRLSSLEKIKLTGLPTFDVVLLIVDFKKISIFSKEPKAG